jgi:hypothetical protein
MLRPWLLSLGFVVLLLPGLTAQSHVLGNGLVEFDFAKARKNLWLDAITSPANQTISFERGTPIWTVELVDDPDDGDPNGYDFDVVPTDLPLSVAVTGVPALGFTKLVATWGPAVVPAPVGSPADDPNLRVIATFKLKDGEDTATAKIDVEILNHDQNDYTIWLTRFPRLAVADLDVDEDGSDRLATGRMGGFLYGDPIDYEDADTYWPLGADRTLQITTDPDHDVLLVSADSLEPGPLGLPLSVYYDADPDNPAKDLGFYHANNDSQGHMKGIYWTREPTLGDGAMLVQTVQYPDTDIYSAGSYSSPYSVQLAALDRGDWIGASQKYRETWRNFGFYPGPVGSAGNDLVSDQLKQRPLAVWLDSGNGYCMDYPQNPFSFTEARDDLDDLSAFFLGTATPPANGGFPYVYLNRYPIDIPHEVSLNGYTPSQTQTMIDVRALIAHAELNHHDTVIHTMTEKAFIIDSDLGDPLANPPVPPTLNCANFGAQCSYCDFDDPDVITMDTENALRRIPGGEATAAPCAAGMGLPAPGGTGVDWPTWFRDLNAEFATTLGVTGGFGWTSPNPVSGMCFSEDHAHEPGFGDFLAQGWIWLLESTASQIGGGPVARTMETCVAFFSQAAAVQTLWNFDIGHDYNHFNGQAGDVDSYLQYQDAPIWRIPMMQMAIDNALYSSVYSPKTLSMPYTAEYAAPPPAVQGLDFFEPFPAMTGALACWSMAERVLSYQSVVFLNNERMVPLDDVNTPGSNPGKNAASDMFRYYRGLEDFLTGTQPTALSDYHRGSLERSPEITIDGVSQTFILDATTIDAELLNFSAAFGVGGFNVPGGTRDLDWAKFQPLRQLMGLNAAAGAIWMPVAPEVDPNYLPSGMYRHHDGESLAFLVTNPWGVEHVDDQGVDPDVPMNPFTFDYGTPTSSPSNNYTYRFTFDPADYDGFPSTYDATLAVYDTDGQAIIQLAYPGRTGAVQFVGGLPPFQSAAWVFTQP